MATTPGTLEQIAIRLGRVLTRLTAGLADDELQETLGRLGLVVPPELLAQPAVVTARNALVTSASALPATIDKLSAAADADDLGGVLQHGAALLTEANALIAAFDTMPAAIDAVRSGFPEVGAGGFADFAASFGRKLLDLLIADALDEVPALGAGLALVGLLERVRPFEATDFDHIDLERTVIHYERIARLFGAPADHFKEVYGWGTPEFDGLTLLPAISDFLAQIGVPTAFHPPSESTGTLLEAYVLDIRPNTKLDPPGLDASVVSPFGGTIDAAVPVTDPAWSGTFSARGVFGTVLTGTVRPPLTVNVAAPAATFEGKAGVRVLGEGPQPFVILGKAGGNRLEVKTITFAAGMTFSTESAAGAEPSVAATLQGGRILVDGSEGDGFVSTILSGVDIDASFDVGLTWNLVTGVRFNGSATLAIMLPVHVDLGPFAVNDISLVAGLDGETIPVEVSTSLACSLGPIDATIGGIGFTATIAFPGTGGNAGPAQVDLAFKAPTGVGLSVEAQGVVTGGGFLFHDPTQQLYAGSMLLSLNETITLSAFGLIGTQMPDGSPGYSLIIFITAEGFQPIPLGMGFTLQGVGGLVAINRTFDQDALTAGLKNDTLKSLLFPANPVGNAPAIIRSLASIFPAKRGSYLLGLLARIGWFTPTLVLMDLALILEFGTRKRLIVLGRISALLPSADDDLVRIIFDAVGVLDFDASTASIDAVLVDSRLARKFTLTGAMALRADWSSGANSGFVLAVGGVNPHFTPPATLPALPRVAIALSSGDNPRLTCQAYFAITSNTVQFGAQADLYAAAYGFSIEGDVGYDVLIQIAPLHFIADFNASVQLKHGSSNLFKVSVAGELEGPRPLRVSGKASFEILWCDFSVPFDKTLVSGDAPPPPLAIDVSALLKQALARPQSWTAVRPVGHIQGVTLRSLPPGNTLVLEPLGQLSVRQQVVPLDTARDIDLFGDAPVSGERRFHLTATLNGVAQTPTPVTDQFAPAQFFAMSDDEKLAAPSFETMAAGLVIGDGATGFDAAEIVAAPLEYDEIIIDKSQPAQPTGRYTLPLGRLGQLARSGAAARAPARTIGLARFRNIAAQPAATVRVPVWTIQPLGDGPAPALDPGIRTWSEHLAALTTLNRATAGFQIVPQYELAA